MSPSGVRSSESRQSPNSSVGFVACVVTVGGCSVVGVDIVVVVAALVVVVTPSVVLTGVRVVVVSGGSSPSSR